MTDQGETGERSGDDARHDAERTTPGDTDVVSRPVQAMKPETAAKKLGIYLPATPEEFQSTAITRGAYNAILASPPTWLIELRKTGPHPRPVVAGKLGVSISGLTRGGVTDALTTAEIQALLEQPPAWLVEERSRQAGVRAEKAASANKKRETAL